MAVDLFGLDDLVQAAVRTHQARDELKAQVAAAAEQWEKLKDKLGSAESEATTADRELRKRMRECGTTMVNLRSGMSVVLGDDSVVVVDTMKSINV
jgi:chromosome condensin MukBEF ATPase and DNA-binding subunit MukB